MQHLYEYSRQYFFNQNLRKILRRSVVFSNVIGVILGRNHAEEGLDAFIKNIQV